MVTVYLVHGAFGSPDENWIPWLKTELEKVGCTVITPTFPTPDGQTLVSWLNVFNQFDPTDSIVVGHSLGVPFLLHVIEKYRIKSAFFVAGFASLLNNPTFDVINRTFVEEFNWDIIKKNCKSFTLYHSDNDPYIPITEAENIAAQLDVSVQLIKNAGHFNEKAGYVTFSKLLDDIKASL